MGTFADEGQSRCVSPVVAERSLELSQIALFDRLRTGSMDTFAVDEPQFPPTCADALRENVPRRNAAPGEPCVVNLVQDAGDCLKDGVTVMARKLGPGSAQNHVGD
jgi:hypothetical protein